MKVVFFYFLNLWQIGIYIFAYNFNLRWENILEIFEQINK